MSKLLRDLANRRLVLVTGKGGAGKSSVSVALAHHFRSLGKRVWLVEIGQRDERSFSRLPELLGVDALQHNPTETHGFQTSLLDPTRCLGEYVDMKLPTAGLASVLLNNRVTSSLLEVVPGLPELVTLGKIWYAITQKKDPPDITIIDAPASGHAVTLLHAPDNFARLTRAGPLWRDAVAMKEFLSDSNQTAVLFTALPEEMALSEAADHQKLLGKQFALPFVVVNKVFPEPPKGKSTGPLEVARAYTENRHQREHGAISTFTEQQSDWLVVEIPFFFPDPSPLPLRIAAEWAP